MARRKISDIPKIDFSSLPDLTQQQQKFVFAIEYDGKTASDAYREAYDCSNSQPSTIWANASRLYHDSNVTAWRSAIRMAQINRGTLSKEQWIKRVLADAEEAKRAGNHGANMQGLKFVGDALGHISNDINVTVSDPQDILSQIAAISPSLAKAFADEFGLNNATEH